MKLFILLTLLLIKADSTNLNKIVFLEQKNVEFDSSSKFIVHETDTISSVGTDTTLEVANRKKVVLFNKESKAASDVFRYIFPILTLLLGIGINRFIDYISKQRQLKSSLRRWTSEIRILERPLRKQISDIESFQEKVLEEKHKIPDMGVYAVLKGETFKSLDKGEFLEALEKVVKIKYEDAINLTNMIYGVIQSLSHYTTQLQFKYDNYIKIVGELTDSLNKDMYHIRKSIAEYGVYLQKIMEDDPIKDESYKKMANLIYEKLIAPNNFSEVDIFELEKNLFLPLLEILSHKRTEEATHNLLEATTNSLHHIQSLKTEKSNVHESIEQIRKELEVQLSEVTKIIARIDKINKHKKSEDP